MAVNLITDTDLRKERFARMLSEALWVVRNEADIDIDRSISETSKEIGRLVLSSESDSDSYLWSPNKYADLAMDYIRYRMAHPGLPGFDTGFSKLNQLLGGFEVDNVYVLNAKSGSGKTTWLLQCAWKLASQTPVIFFSPEARAAMLSRRLIAALAHVPNGFIRRGDITDEQFSALEKAKQLMKTRPLYIYDMPEVNTSEMEAVIDRIANEVDKHPGVIFVDYLQQMNGEDSFQHLTNNMKSLETLTVRRHVATIVASQISRGAGDGSSIDAGKGSGKIEELASAVLGLVIPSAKDGEDGEDVRRTRRVLHCTKNREEGITFELPLRFNEITGWLEEVND